MLWANGTSALRRGNIPQPSEDLKASMVTTTAQNHTTVIVYRGITARGDWTFTMTRNHAVEKIVLGRLGRQRTFEIMASLPGL